MQAYYNKELISSNIKRDYYEVNMYGCNFNCLFCSKKEYLKFVSDKLEDLTKLKERIKILNPIGIIITGGEPLLQRQAVLNVLNFCRKNNIKTGIITNASKPNELKSILKAGLLDLIVVDIHTSEKEFKKITRTGTFFKPSEEIYAETIKSIKILKEYDKELKIIFRTNIIPGYVYRKEDLLDIAENIAKIRAIWLLKRFNPHNGLFENIIPVSESFMQDLKRIIYLKYPNLTTEVEQDI